jgi:hypothetical protein
MAHGCLSLICNGFRGDYLYAATRDAFLAERTAACRLREGEPDTGVAADGAFAELRQRVGLRSRRYP